MHHRTRVLLAVCAALTAYTCKSSDSEKAGAESTISWSSLTFPLDTRQLPAGTPVPDAALAALPVDRRPGAAYAAIGAFGGIMGSPFAYQLVRESNNDASRVVMALILEEKKLAEIELHETRGSNVVLSTTISPSLSIFRVDRRDAKEPVLQRVDHDSDGKVEAKVLAPLRAESTFELTAFADKKKLLRDLFWVGEDGELELQLIEREADEWRQACPMGRMRLTLGSEPKGDEMYPYPTFEHVYHQARVYHVTTIHGADHGLKVGMVMKSLTDDSVDELTAEFDPVHGLWVFERRDRHMTTPSAFARLDGPIDPCEDEEGE